MVFSATPTAAFIGSRWLLQMMLLSLRPGSVGGQIGNREMGFEGPHFAGDVFAHQEFHVIAARLQRESGVVLIVLAHGLGGVAFVQLDLDEVANVADHRFRFVLNLADKIELRDAAPPLAASATTDPGTFTETGTKYAPGDTRK